MISKLSPFFVNTYLIMVKFVLCVICIKSQYDPWKRNQSYCFDHNKKKQAIINKMFSFIDLIVEISSNM